MKELRAEGNYDSILAIMSSSGSTATIYYFAFLASNMKGRRENSRSAHQQASGHGLFTRRQQSISHLGSSHLQSLKAWYDKIPDYIILQIFLQID